MIKKKGIRRVYPVRDNMLVEHGKYPMSGIPLGMQPTKNDVAYLRHAVERETLFSTNITSLRDEKEISAIKIRDNSCHSWQKK